MGLELTWSIVPLIIVMGVFFWGMHGLHERDHARPANALEIQRDGEEVGLAVRVSGRHTHSQ